MALHFHMLLSPSRPDCAKQTERVPGTLLLEREGGEENEYRHVWGLLRLIPLRAAATQPKAVRSSVCFDPRLHEYVATQSAG